MLAPPCSTLVLFNEALRTLRPLVCHICRPPQTCLLTTCAWNRNIAAAGQDATDGKVQFCPGSRPNRYQHNQDQNIINRQQALPRHKQFPGGFDCTSTLKDLSEMPGPPSYPLIGSTLYTMRHPDFNLLKIHEFWSSVASEFGPIFRFQFPGSPQLVCTTDACDVETVMRSTLEDPQRPFLLSLKKVRDKEPSNFFRNKAGLLCENGAEWWRVRSRVQGALLRPRSVEHYLPSVDGATLEFIDRLEGLRGPCGQLPDTILDELYKWALECVGLVALDRKLGCLDPASSPDSPARQMQGHINGVFEAVNDTELGTQSWRLYRSSAFKRLEAAHSAFLRIADENIQTTVRKLASAPPGQGGPRTVVETLLGTEGLTREDTATLVLDMLLAGMDTTAHAAAFALFQLARNPSVQSELQGHVDRVLGSSAAPLTPEQLNEMLYITFVLKETLRLHPLTVGTARILPHEVAMSGFRIPKGTLAMGFNMQMSRDPRYFAQPDVFAPERWARQRPLGPIHPFASLPFSHGKRMCVGRRIAEQEIHTLIARIMQRYTVHFDGPPEMKVKTQLVLKPDIPLQFSLVRRS